MSTFIIPASIEDATRALSGIDALLTAKDWERAAIVAAFVEVGEQHQNRHVERTSALLTPKGFAALGIAGLKSDNTVRRYVEAWASTGLPRPTPGEEVEMPTAAFPTVKTKAQDVAQQPGAVATALADPAFVAKVADRISEEAIAALVANPKVRAAGYEAVKAEVETVKDANRKPHVEDDGRRPSEGAVGDGLIYLIETEEIDESLTALVSQTQKVADVLRGGGLNVHLAKPDVRAEAQAWVQEVKTRLSVIEVTVDFIADTVRAGGVEDPDAALARLLS